MDPSPPSLSTSLKKVRERKNEPKALIIQSADIVFICATDIKSGQRSIYIAVLRTASAKLGLGLFASCGQCSVSTLPHPPIDCWNSITPSGTGNYLSGMSIPGESPGAGSACPPVLSFPSSAPPSVSEFWLVLITGAVRTWQKPFTIFPVLAALEKEEKDFLVFFFFFFSHPF